MTPQPIRYTYADGPHYRDERLLALALTRGDRIAAINLAQRLWSAGDVRRTAVVALRLPDWSA